jgi:hypothetical protein
MNPVTNTVTLFSYLALARIRPNCPSSEGEFSHLAGIVIINSEVASPRRK